MIISFSQLGRESALFVSILIIAGASLTVLALRRLYTSWYEWCTFAEGKITVRRAGVHPVWSVTYEKISDFRFSGMVFTLILTDGSSYRIVCPFSLQSAIHQWLDEGASRKESSSSQMR